MDTSLTPTEPDPGHFDNYQDYLDAVAAVPEAEPVSQGDWWEAYVEEQRLAYIDRNDPEERGL